MIIKCFIRIKIIFFYIYKIIICFFRKYQNPTAPLPLIRAMQLILTKMKTHRLVKSSFLKKSLVFAALIFGVISTSLASDTKAELMEETDFQLELSELKELPSITLVDKNLRIVAEFYGDPSEVQNRFGIILQSSALITKYNNRSIYLITE